MSHRRFNATRHGLRAAATVLPWESVRDYEALRAAVIVEHRPVGQTETALVDELAKVLWRLQRVHIAEASAWRDQHWQEAGDRGDMGRLLGGALPGVAEPDLYATDIALRGADGAAYTEAGRAEALTRAAETALALVDQGRPAADVVAALPEFIREWWLDDAHDPDDAEELEAWLQLTALRWSRSRSAILRGRTALQAHAAGAAFKGDRLDLICRYETHLHRSLGRVLALLTTLQEQRRTIPAAPTSFGKNSDQVAAALG